MTKRLISCTALKCCAAMTSGCLGHGSGSSDEPEPRVWIGPDATLDDVLAAADELSADVVEAFGETGDQPLGYTDLPTAGQATYTGLMLGEGQPDSGPLVDYAADLRLNVDFEDQNLNGSITNVATTLHGFNHPEGTISVTGSLYEVNGFAGLDFTGSGILREGEHAASYRLPEVYGAFGGQNAQAVDGYQATNLAWTEGPSTGTNSSSDGGFIAVTE